MQNYRKILIVRTDRIGDVILTLPMARVLKNEYPDVHITFLIRQYTSELVADDENVDDIIFYNGNKRKDQLFSFVKTIKEKKFDAVFHTHPIIRLALITWLAGIPERIGTGYRWYSFLFNKKIFEHRKYAEYHELDYNLHLLRAVGCNVKDGTVKPHIQIHKESFEKIDRLLNDKGINHDHRLIILHPGSGRSARDWSARNFGELGNLLVQLHNVKVVITGGGNERPIMNLVKSYSIDRAISIEETLTLREFAALIKHADLFIANSTGPLHIAAAVGVPVIGFYPQIKTMSAERWGPYTDRKIIFTPQGKPPKCKKCLHRQKISCECMNSITVEEVFNATKNFLYDFKKEEII